MKKKNIIIFIILAIVVIIIGYITIIQINKHKKEYEIEKIDKYNYFVVKEDGKYGVINRNGDKIIETNYDNVKIPNPKKSVFFCYDGDSIIVLNDKSEQILTQYETVEPLRLTSIISDLMYEKSVLKYSDNGKYGIIDFNGKKITKAIYDEINTLQYKEGELIVKREDKYGVININGVTLVDEKYEKIESDKYYTINNGYRNSGYIVCNTTQEGYRYGYIDRKGNEILEVKYNDLWRIQEIDSIDAYIVCADNGKYGVYRNNKQIIGHQYQAISYNDENRLIIALKSKKYGAITLSEQQIIPFLYSQINISGKYIYAVGNDGNTIVYDSLGNETNIGAETAIIDVENTKYKIHIDTKDGKTLYSIYVNNQCVTTKDYAYLEYLYNDYFIASDINRKIGIIDINENLIVDCIYTSMQKVENTDIIEFIDIDTNISYFYSKDMNKVYEIKDPIIENKNGYIEIYNENERIYLSEEGNIIQEKNIFEKNELFAREQDGLWGYVDKNENIIINYQYDFATEVNEYGFAGVKKNGKWGIINGAGQIVVEPVYEIKQENEPEFIGQYYKVIYGNGEIYYSNAK